MSQQLHKGKGEKRTSYLYACSYLVRKCKSKICIAVPNATDDITALTFNRYTSHCCGEGNCLPSIAFHLVSDQLR